MSLTKTASHFFTKRPNPSGAPVPVVGLMTPFMGGPIWENGIGSDSRRSMVRNRPTEYIRELPTWRWRDQLAAARYLYANMAAIRGLYADRATYVAGAGWRAKYTGPDRAWGKDAKQWLEQWLKNSDVKGSPYTNAVHLRAGSLALDRDGDYAIQRVKGPNGYPLIQVHPAHRIGTRYDTPFVEASGPYKGMMVVSGVVLNEYGRPVALNILGNQPNLDTLVPMEDIKLVFSPDFFDACRGLTNLAQALDDWGDVRDFRDFEKMAVKVGAAHTIIEANETGTNEDRDTLLRNKTGAGVSPDSTNNNVQVQSYSGGLIRYILSRGRGNIKMMEHNRPSPNTQQFIEGIVRTCCNGAEWPYEFAFDMSKLTSAGVHGIFGKAQRSVEVRQGVLTEPQDWTAQYGLACAMLPESKGGLGLLPFNQGWNTDWAWQLPRKIGADESKNGAQEIEEIKMGTKTVRQVVEADGLDYEAHREERFSEADELLTDAEELHKRHPDWTLQECLQQIQMLTPNGNTSNQGKGSDSEQDPVTSQEPVNSAGEKE